MSAPAKAPVLDRFRLAAAVLVITIQTSPLLTWTETGDFLLTRVLARVAVPFFLMTSGYFLARDGWRGTGRFLKCTVLLYAAAVLLYLPLNLYRGGFPPLEGVKTLLICAVLALSLLLAGALYALRPLPVPPDCRAWKELDLNALAHNARALEALLPDGCALMAVVKADAYGHGGVQAARCLQKNGVRAFAAATLEEGIALRRAGVRGTILILGWTDPALAPQLARWRLTQTVASEAHGLALAAQGRRLRVHLALDTGMRRLGVPAEDFCTIQKLFQQKNLCIDGVFSHLCAADELSPGAKAFTLAQQRAFYRTVEWMRGAGLNPGKVHLQASAGLLNLPPQPCDYVRAGIALYGLSSAGDETLLTPALRPVLSLRARVAAVRTLEAGETAGYGCAFQARRPTRLAVLSIGYADGLPRALAQRGGQVLLHGRAAPMAGRMCMDQLLADVTEIPETAAGDVATLIGRDGPLELRAEELAAQCGTITNELLSRLGPRLGLVL